MNERLNILVFTLIIVLLMFFLSREVRVSDRKEVVPIERVNINSANKEDILKLPFIGEKRADSIIEKRKLSRLYANDLKKIIGNKTFNKISSKISY